LAALDTTLGHRATMVRGDVYGVSTQERYRQALRRLNAGGVYRAPVFTKARQNYLKRHTWDNIAEEWNYLFMELREKRK